MRINRMPNYGTSFTSDVYISSKLCNNNDHQMQKLLNDENFQEELDKLRHNGNNDTVLLGYSQGEMSMTITEKSGNRIKWGTPLGGIYRAEDVAKQYKEGKENLKSARVDIVPSAIVDYII